MMDYQEFLNKLQKKGSNAHSINHCYGVRNAWKWVRRNKWKLTGTPVSQSTYGNIINTINLLLVEQIIDGHEAELPWGMGSMYLASVPSKVTFKDGELKTNYRTDWLKTLQLWYKDSEARNTHKIVKRIQNNIVFIKYDKRRANYNNRRFYLFRANRSMVRKVGKAVEEGRAVVMDVAQTYQ